MKQERMTAEQFRKMFDRGTANAKFRNKKTVVDGIVFDSQLEANRYCTLKLLKASGEIQGFGRQPSFILNDGGKVIRYRPDFIVCGADGSKWVEDAKGVETPEFKLKRKLWEREYPWLPLKIIRE